MYASPFLWYSRATGNAVEHWHLIYHINCATRVAPSKVQARIHIRRLHLFLVEYGISYLFTEAAAHRFEPQYFFHREIWPDIGVSAEVFQYPGDVRISVHFENNL